VPTLTYDSITVANQIRLTVKGSRGMFRTNRG
jgi:hypothetical protein